MTDMLATPTMLTPAALSREWNVDDRCINDFLTAKGVEPVTSMKYGRGVMRIYPPETRNLRLEFLAFMEQRRAKAAAAFEANNFRIGNKTIRNKALRDQLNRIESKLDSLVSALS